MAIPRRYLCILASCAALLLSACSSSGGAPSSSHFSVAASVAGVGTLPTPASAWPEAGYNARFASGTTAVGPQTGAVRWHRALGGDATPGPVIAVDGSILEATNSGVLHDLDAATGDDVWTYDAHAGYGSDLSTSAAVLANGTILWPGPNSTLYALSATGAPLWQEHFAGQVLSPAIAGAGRIYVADLAGHLSALRVSGSDHTRLWTLDLGGQDYASPTVGQDGTIYTAAGNDLVAVHDTGTAGAVAWRFHARQMVEVSNAVAADGTVILGTNDHTEYGITPDGAVRWTVDVGDRTYSSATVGADGQAYFGDNSGRVRTVGAATGTVVRTVSPAGDGAEKVWTSIAVDARGDSYWGSTAGNVYGYDSTGTQLFRLHANAGLNSYPALGQDGTLYIGTTAGTLYAIGS